MLDNLVLQIIKISLTTSVLIGALLLLIPLIQKRYRVQWRYVAWIVLAVRLLIPINFTLPLIPTDIKLPKADEIVVTPMDTQIEDTVLKEVGKSQPETDHLMEVPQIILDIPKPTLSYLEIIGFTWIFGICAFLLFQVGAYQIFLRKLKSSDKENIPEFIKETMLEIALEMGIGKLPDPVVSNAVSAPVLIGIINPRILLPHTNYSEPEISFILRHELSHYRRKDIWYKLVLMLANAIHWFNPLIYLMTAQAARDIESMCDCDVAQNFNYNERTQYANTILSALPRKRGFNPMFSTQFGSSKQNVKSRLRNLFDMKNKRRGIAALCTLVLFTLFGTGMVTFAYAASDTSQGQLALIDGLLVNAKAVDSTWASATGIISKTWEKQMEEEIEWLDEVYSTHKSNFVIKETLPFTEATNTARLEYLYKNSDVFRNMSQMKNGVFRVEDSQSFSGFGIPYVSGMMQRTAVMIDNGTPVSLDIDYELTQGEMTVYLVNPNGKIMYYGAKAATMKDRISFNGEKGLWSVISVVDSKDNRLSGSISISLLLSSQNNQQSQSPSSDSNFSVERLGQHSFEKGDSLNADLEWDGNGYVILLCTKNNLNDDEILKQIQGVSYIPEPDESKVDLSKLGGTMLLSQSVKSPLHYDLKIIDSATYYCYLIRISNPSKIIGTVNIKKSNETTNTIWTQMKDNSMIQNPDTKPFFQITSNNGKNVAHSGSFVAKSGQILTISSTSSIKGGTVDLFLFSPSGKEQRITFGSSDTTKSVELSEGTWAYNTTGLFESGNIVITGSVSGDLSNTDLQANKETIQNKDSLDNSPIIYLSNNGGKNVIQSGSFKSKASQKLTINATSNIKGGTVDLFLFSPSGEEQRITFSGSDITKTVELSEGTWAYNATGFFESGNITINCTIS